MSLTIIGGSGCLGDAPTDDSAQESLEGLEPEDVVEFVNFDPVTNEVYVELVSDPPVDSIMLTTAVADEEATLAIDETDEVQSIPVDHQGDTLTVTGIENDAEAVIHEEEWSPPTADDFGDERIDNEDAVVREIEVAEDDMGYSARVNIVDDPEATEILIKSTVAKGEFQSDSLDVLDYGAVQINAVEDEVTVTAINNGDEEIVHREQFQPGD